MRGTLILAVLSVRSSYARGVEESAAEDQVSDTLQWWVGSPTSWRIKTYALDHDIHTHDVGSRADMVQLAETNNLKHYGDIIKVQHVLEFVDCTDSAEVQRVLGGVNLAGRLEVAAGRFAFWKPDDARYWTQSTPQ
jgi:hypothetical protein